MSSGSKRGGGRPDPFRRGEKPGRPKRRRLDQALVEAGLAPSRARAQALVMAGKVLVDGEVVHKPGHAVPAGAALGLKEPDHGYVSRGGVKLAGALDRLGWDPTGRVVLDVGASTGGFTDCLLQRGATHVIALDVGYGQLHWKLRQDPRVTVIERTNIRDAAAETLRAAGGPAPDAAVVDVSFISLTLVLPRLFALLPPGAPVLALIKPQFEAGRDEVGKGGVVRDPAVRQACIDKITALCREAGARIQGTVPSSLPGPKGNVEELIALTTPPRS